MPDPNARRDKALETIARELGETNSLLKKIERNTRRVTITNHPERPDPFDQPQEPQPEPLVDRGPPFPQSSHPYFKRSASDGEPADPGVSNQGTGPYGVGTPPYE